jgi:hypothetical protein
MPISLTTLPDARESRRAAGAQWRAEPRQRLFNIVSFPSGRVLESASYEEKTCSHPRASAVTSVTSECERRHKPRGERSA